MTFSEIIGITGLLIGFFLMFSIPNLTKHIEIKLKKSVSIIIPARNEAKRIKPLLDSLKKQSLDVEVIVVDDESTDGTAEVVATYGFKVIQSQALPKGWRGKAWASHQGAQHAKNDILVFLDADTILSDDGLEKMVAYFMMDETPVSIQPYHKMRRPYEQLSLIFNIVVMMSSNLYTPFGRKLKPKVFYGPCQIMLKADYERIGGHEHVKGAILEDIEIGKRLINNNRSIRSIAGKGAIYFRMYPDGILDILKGWSKNFATGAFSIGIINMLMVSLWIFSIYSIWVTFLMGLPVVSWINVTSFVLMGFELFWIGCRIGNFNFMTIVLYPIQALFFLFVFINSFIRTFFVKKVTWKDRSIDLDDKEL